MAESTPQTARTPWHLWVVGGTSLLWNCMGAMDFVMTETRNKAYLASATPAQLDYYGGFPAWAVAAWGIAVWGGVLGSLLLLLRRRVAAHVFAASLVCIALTDLYSFVLSNGLKVTGGGAGSVIFAGVIMGIGVALLMYARSMGRRGVLR